MNKIAKVILTVLAVLFILGGAVWFLQGTGALPGSAMSGKSQWAIYGGIAVVVGVVLLLVAYMRRKSATA